MCTAYTGWRVRGGGCALLGGLQLPAWANSRGCRCNNTCNEMRIELQRLPLRPVQHPGEWRHARLLSVVVCQNPATIDGFDCSSSGAGDDRVCAQRTDCLTPLVQASYRATEECDRWSSWSQARHCCSCCWGSVGSLSAKLHGLRAVVIAADPHGGYLILTGDGGVHPFGKATFYGSAAGKLPKA